MKKIAIHSVPRSGSSWLGQIFNSSPKVNFKFQPLFSYPFKSYLDENSSLETINSFFEKIAVSDDPFVNQTEEIKKGSYPIFVKEDKLSFIVYKEVRYHHILKNLLEKDNQIIVVGLIRNPLAVINSWRKAPKEFRKDEGWDFMSEWRYAPLKNKNKKEEFNGYEKWKEVALLFEELQKTYPNRFYLMEYKKLITEPVKYIKELFEFCSIPLETSTLNFISESTSASKFNDDSYSVYKNSDKEDLKWKNELLSSVIEFVFNDLKNSDLKKYLI